jgi:transposase
MFQEGHHMPAPLSNDIRLRIVQARKERGFTYEEIADRLSVGHASVVRILRLERNTGHIEPKVYRPGPPPKVDEQRAPVLRALVEQHIDATEEELSDAFAAKLGISVHRSSINRALKRLKITRKKRPS